MNQEPRVWKEDTQNHWLAAERSALKTLEVAERNVGRLSLELMGQQSLWEPHEFYLLTQDTQTSPADNPV